MKVSRMKEIKVSRNQILIFLAGSFIFISFLIVILRSVWGGVKQPISFNHQTHAENGLECLDCHPYFEERASSGKPSLETCAGCHEEPQGESKAEREIVEYVKSGKEVEWQRLYRVPEDVYFSHKRHVVMGEIECNICHGDIGTSSSPPSKSQKIAMKNCMKCHEEKEADNDCIACHR